MARQSGCFDFNSAPTVLAQRFEVGGLFANVVRCRNFVPATASASSVCGVSILATSPSSDQSAVPASKPFTLLEPEFDQATFWGRLKTIMNQLDPLQLFTSQAVIDRSVQLMDDFKVGIRDPSVTDAELWEARNVVAARCHPDTGEKIFTPLCFACYVPMQPVIVMGMMLPGGGMLNQAFWQWYNQSYNVAVVCANKNKSSPMTLQEIGVSYAVAVSSALAISLGMKKLGESRPNNTFLRLGGPFCACVAAGCISLIYMRKDELRKGVQLKDAHGHEYGLSKTAAKYGIGMACFARFLWNIPVLALGPLIMQQYGRSAFHLANPRVRLPVEVAVITALVCIGVYPAQAVFSQTASIDAHTVEPQFQGVCNPETGQPVKTFLFNKGL